MAKHILDRTNRAPETAPVERYARAARAQFPLPDRKATMLMRRTRGTFDTSARLKAYLRIERFEGGRP